MKNKKQRNILIVLFLVLTILLSSFLYLKKTKTGISNQKDLEVLQVAPATVSNVTLSLVTDKTSINQGESAVISIKSTTVPTGYKFLGFIVVIKVPKTLTPTFITTSFPSVLSYDFVYPADSNSYSSAILDKGTYWEIQALAAENSSTPISLVIDTTIFNFNITPANTTTSTAAIEFIIDPNGSYPSVVSADLTEAKLTTANISIDLNKKVNQAALTITTTSGTAGTALTLTTTGGSGTKAVTYATTTSGCSISGTSLSRATAGTCSVVATNPANGIYNAVKSSATTVSFTGVKGDVNGDNKLNVGDVSVIINLVFEGGATPAQITAGDMNGDGKLNVIDAFLIIEEIFK